MIRRLILLTSLCAILSACAGSERPVLPPPPAPVETRVVFAPLDGALLDCPDGPDLAAAMAQVEAVKYDPKLPTVDAKANAIIGIQGVTLLRYQNDLTACRDNLDAIRAAQGKVAPGQ